MKREIDQATLEKIERGEIIVRGIERSDAENRLQAEAVGIIRADKKQLNDILVDYEKYPQLFPEVKRCKVLERFEGGFVVEMTVSVFFLLPEYHATVRIEQHEDYFSWKMIAGDMKEMHGYWYFIEQGPGKTVAFYSNTVVMKGLLSLIPNFIIDKVVTIVLPGVIRTVIKILKKRGIAR